MQATMRLFVAMVQPDVMVEYSRMVLWLDVICKYFVMNFHFPDAGAALAIFLKLLLEDKLKFKCR